MRARLLHAAAVVLLSLLIGFLTLRLAPGDPMTVVVEQLARTESAREALRRQYGLQGTIGEQLARYVVQIARGDWGVSLRTGRAIGPDLLTATRNSLLLACAGLAGAGSLGLVVGTLHGWFPERVVARSAGTALTAIYALPEFVLALVLLVSLSYHAGLFPLGGIIDVRVAYESARWPRVVSVLHHLVLPASTLALGWGAVIARMQRHALSEVAREPFVRTAYAKGNGPLRVMVCHGSRAALPSVVTGIALMIPALFGGTVVVEVLYSWPGMGSLLVDAIAARDYPMASGAMLIVGVIVASSMLAAEALCWRLDPRVRLLPEIP